MDIKFTIGAIITVCLQMFAAVWYIAQTDAVIEDLNVTVAEMSSTMAIENNVNFKRDVESNRDTVTSLNTELNAMSSHVTKGIGDYQDIARRLSIMEVEYKYMQKELNSHNHRRVKQNKGG